MLSSFLCYQIIVHSHAVVSLLVISQMLQAHSRPKAFALAIPSALNAFLRVSKWLASWQLAVFAPVSSQWALLSPTILPNSAYTPLPVWGIPTALIFSTLTYHLLICGIIYLIVFIVCLPFLVGEDHEGRNFCLICSLMYSCHLERCSAYSRQSIDPCGIDK